MYAKSIAHRQGRAGQSPGIVLDRLSLFAQADRFQYGDMNVTQTRVRFASEPDSCIRFAVEVRHAADRVMRGGDLFEVQPWSDGSAMLIADVSSKGSLSVVHTEMIRRAFRTCATTQRSPAAMMAMLNRLRFDGPPPNDSVTFAAATIVAVDRGAMTCRYASAGHDIGLFIRGRAHRHLVPTGPVLGVFPDADYEDRVEPFGFGDVLVLATDGFTECRRGDAGAPQFGTAGIARAAAAATGSFSEIARSIARSADEHTNGSYRDDATLAVIVRDDIV